MKSSDKTVALPLDYVSEIAFEIHLMRSECSDAARRLMLQPTLDEVALEECALMDDALARAKLVLEAAVLRVKRSRKNKGKRAP